MSWVKQVSNTLKILISVVTRELTLQKRKSSEPVTRVSFAFIFRKLHNLELVKIESPFSLVSHSKNEGAILC